MHIFNMSVCLFDMILYVPSTIFQLNGDGSSWVEPVLSYDKCVFLNYILCSCTMSNDLPSNGIMTLVNFNNWRLKSDVSFDLKTNSLIC